MTAAKVPTKLSAMTGKWSTKPPDHAITRVRNNQRRHRARVKTHISDLEQKLGDTQRLLSHAEARIAQLTAELDSFRNGHLPSPPCEEPGPESPNGDFIASAGGELADSSMKEHIVPYGTHISRCSSDPRSISIESEAEAVAGTQTEDHFAVSPLASSIGRPRYSSVECTAPIAVDEPHPLCCSSGRVQPSQRPADEASGCTSQISAGAKDALEKAFLSLPMLRGNKESVDQQYPDLDPEQPDESTTLCSNAFVLIEQQNVRGLDISVISERLQQGFRRIESGHGDCGVENRVLFALLDHISSS
ncbi:uncharacterized protein BP5553_00057 [Venustampulla echinocandica]|uniref:BZIP domain-containing protein n=1 Tax=Venustampulla echinocandica TaxID=2656787 RepID=A0A370TX71_9HELO|nr:uncharacterized protein BP5553_00057 [Venustampulla echinocandica]RDL40078.1 hypothetical protein BP5553_00057 [Venustampulla echinocandica]